MQHLLCTSICTPLSTLSNGNPIICPLHYLAGYHILHTCLCYSVFFFFWFFFSRVSAWTLSLQISSRTAVSLQLNVIVFFSVFLWKVMLVGQLLLRACLYQSSRFFGYFVQGGEGHDTQHILLFLRLHPSSYIFVQATNPYNILC